MPGREPTKTRRTYYAEGRIAAARENVERYDWAAERRDAAVEEAEAVVDRGLDALWSAVTGQEIPRSFSPGDGTQRERWKPVEGRSWAVTDGEWTLPTNDFAAYRESGLDDRGFFAPERADDSLLVNEEHPEMGDGWGVDDGRGWVDEAGAVDDAGTHWTPVAFYNHWHVWYELRDAATALRDAFLLTGDERYARAGTVLLDRVADVYPALSIDPYAWDPYRNSHGMTGQGKAVGSIWECSLIRPFLSAYDAFFPRMDDERALGFLAERAEVYPGLDAKESAAAVRANVEERIVREILPAVQAGDVRGNLGMHHSTLATAAVVLDEPEGYTGEALDFLFRPGGVRTPEGLTWDDMEMDFDRTLRQDWKVTGGNLSHALVDYVDRDGYGHESAPNYNTIVQGGVRLVADVLDRYDRAEEVDADLYDHPKVRPLLESHADLVMLDEYVPHVGDDGLTGSPGLDLDRRNYRRAFERYGDPETAQFLRLLAGDDDVHGDLFSPDAGALGDRIDDVVERDGPFDPGSVLLPAYGFAALRDGEGDDRRAFWLYFGRNSEGVPISSSHAHQDALNFGAYARGLDLAPDLGYPERTGGWPKARNWTKNTVSHNTVVVDAERQQPQRVGDPAYFDDAGRVGAADVAAPRAYPDADEYRRTTVTVRVDDADSYALDVFRVAGGDDHCYSFHAGEGNVATDGLDLTAQDGGTYAGPDVPFPEEGEETAYDREAGNGFNYLSEVEHDDDPEERFVVDWDVADTWDARDDDSDAHLRLTMLADCEEVALADGHPPQKGGNPESLRYLLARRRGDDLDTAFTALLEPYEGSRRVERVERVPVTRDGEPVDPAAASAVRVELDDGRVDHVVSARDPDAEHVVADRFRVSGRLAVCSEREGDLTYAYLGDGTLLAADGDALLDHRDRDRLRGRVVDFTRDLSQENELVVATDADPAGLVGERVYAEADGDWNAVYEIAGATASGDGRVTLDVGGTTFVRRHADPEDRDAGFRYTVAEGAVARVPRSAVWTAEE